MEFADLIDLEAQLVIDEGEDGAALHARDRALFRGMTPPPQGDAATLSAWVAALRARAGGQSLGLRVATGQRMLGILLAVLGGVSGWGTAEVLLHFEQGTAPINVGHYLGVIVAGQLLTLALLFVGLLLRGLWPAWPLVSEAQRVLRDLTTRYAEKGLSAVRGPVDAQALVGAFRRIRTRASLHAPIERWLLLCHSQVFFVVFNLGVVAAFVRLVLFSDLAFAWSTTASAMDAATVHSLCELLAGPFRLAFPEAAPSLALIEHTQYFRLEGRFVGHGDTGRGDPALVGQWWPFLLACTVTYGLLPRAVLLAAFRLRLWRAERRLPLDTPDLQRVLRRLRTPLVTSRAAVVGDDAAPAARPVAQAATDATRAALVLYRDVPTSEALLRAAVERELALEVEAVQRAGSLNVSADAALCKKLGGSDAAVVVVAEAWEAPDKTLRNFLSAVRAAVGPRRAVLVALIGQATARGFGPVDPQDARVFRDRLTLLDDPYLAVETLSAVELGSRGDAQPGGHP